MQKIVSYVPLKAVGAHLQTDVPHLQKSLKRLNSDEIITICIKLSLLTSNTIGKSSKKRQMQALRILENDGLLESADHQRILAYCRDAESKNLEAVPINRAALLELIRWTSLYSESLQPGQIPFHRHLRQSFIQALLTCAEFYGEREIAPTLPRDAKREEKQDLFILGSRRGAMWSGSHADPLLDLGRTELLLIPFLQVTPEYEDAFQTIYGIHWRDWMKCNVALILTSLLPKDPEMQSNSLNGAFEFDEDLLVGEAQGLRSQIPIYLKKISQTISELKVCFSGSTFEKPKPFPFRALRQKPVIELTNEKLTVIDRRLFLDQMKVGPLFAIARHLKTEIPIQKYGDACHQYAFKLLSSANNAQTAENKCPFLVNSPAGTKMPLNDLALSDGKTLALIEAKGVWLNDDLLSEQDVKIFLSHVFQKYAKPRITVETKVEGAKGMGQLAEVILGLTNGSLQGLGEASFVNDAKEIVPVLLVQDELVKEALISRRLSNEFANLIGIERNLHGFYSHHGWKIYNAIVLSLSDLELIESAILKSRIVDVLAQYAQYSVSNLATFSQFFETSNIKLNWRPPQEQIVRGSAIKILDRVEIECFAGDSV